MSSLQSELRGAEAQVAAAVLGQGAAVGAQERLSGSIAALEAALAEKVGLINEMKLEHEALRKAHASLAAEGAVRQQLVDSLGETAREVSRASETSTAALVADLAAAEHNANEAGGERDTLRRELSSERAEHEACRLQLISAQAALQRVRADSADAVATEGVRLTLALDELRRADRLAGVIHRSLHDAVRGASEVAGGGGGGGGGLLFGEGGGGGLWGGSASLRASRRPRRRPSPSAPRRRPRRRQAWGAARRVSTRRPSRGSRRRR